jgi:hypothetical protein
VPEPPELWSPALLPLPFGSLEFFMAFAFPSVSFCPPGSGGSFLLLDIYKNGAKLDN